MRHSLSRFQLFAWFTIAYNIFVVLFGAVVRATGSGAGCGAHWPLCNGMVIPRPERVETIIEFSHRITSGFTLLFIVILLIWVWKKYLPGSNVRKAVIFALVFTVFEALVGAWLVLFRLVEDNDSVHRAIMMMIHLVNTFLLLASLAITAWLATFTDIKKLEVKGTNGLLVVIGCIVILFLGASGAITALGDTLFPSASLAEGIQADFSSTAHLLIRMRIYHPGIAVGAGIYLALVAMFLRRKIDIPRSNRLATSLLVLFVVQLFIGVLNVFLLAPVWMQVIHLLVSCLVWLNFVLFSVDVFSSLSSRLSHKDIHEAVY